MTSSPPDDSRLVEIFRGKGVQPWFLRLVAANGKTLSTSEGYLTRWNAKRAARKNFPGVEVKFRD